MKYGNVLEHLVSATILVFVLSSSAAAKPRHYYIAAEDITWDYAPSGRDLIHGAPIPELFRGHTQWHKTRYIEYTDATFSVHKPQPEWLGILGPIIRAEVGDTVFVHFLNRSQSAHSIHPHGLRYDKDNEGAAYLPYGNGAGVAPGARFTYRWTADANSGPVPGGPNSMVWWYHSHVDAEKEINAGLLGPIIVTARGRADASGAPRDVDREFVVMFMIFDEEHGKDPGLFHSINGYVFGNLPGLLIRKGERVRWYLMAMGNERDLHTPHWHGETVLFANHHADVVELLPGSTTSADMLADNPGTWMLHCHVFDHMESGMMVSYTIYEAARACPVKIVPDTWVHASSTLSVRVRNVSGKPIRQVSMMSAYLASVLDLEPLFLTWLSPGPIPGGHEDAVSVGSEMFSHGAELGLAFFPNRVVYEDGSAWKPHQLGDCFGIYWRNPDHPQLPVLPPFQLKHKDD